MSFYLLAMLAGKHEFQIFHNLGAKFGGIFF